ncbi:hypothetical protein [Clostridium lacusfryxellense]|uniref:hypothetical protein n=1 Tax=Clostridium lacusfryxellense TaxID=205328 RepID=UPI001C0C06CB|nr:hypothetical protein [Clostridium lacusfryxellense]MBU3110091.1 hypothetical protein [Clostridium lacusfryxellense]
MRRMKDIFYINAFPENNEVVYYGVQLKEFLKYIPTELNQLLLLESEYYSPGCSSSTKLEMVDKDDMEEFLNENIYGYGNFCWVDYNERENVESLEPLELAELLYLGHMFKPVKSPFFDRIQNRYAYLAHDDGWFCRVYSKCYPDFEEVIVGKVIDVLSSSKRRKIYPFSKELREKLLELAKDGLLIDFNNIFKYGNSIEIPIYCIGKFLDMDEMYNDLKRHINRSKYSARLVQKNKKWIIDYIIEKQ